MLGKLKAAVKYWNYPARTFIPDTIGWRIGYRKFAETLHPIENRRRRRLAAEIESAVSMEAEGFAKIRLGDENIDRLRHVRDIAQAIEWERSDHKKQYLMQHDLAIDDDSTVRDFVASNEILAPIARYLGSFPVFASACIWYSPNEARVGGSQDFHMDSEDLRQLKVFLPLDTISEASGPLHLISAEKSAAIYERALNAGIIRVRTSRIGDADVERFCPKSEWIRATGEFGDAIYVDTSRCYHFGSRPGDKPRLLLSLQYYTHAAMEVPLFVRSPADYADEPQTYLFGYHNQLFPALRRRDRATA